ncbi:MAG: hypothetical protein WC867_04760 [Candidatus Pacearchaeota archaeon]|jgi:hypothetical protein
MLTLKQIIYISNSIEQGNSPSRVENPNLNNENKSIRLDLRYYETPSGDVVISKYDPNLIKKGYNELV